MMVVSAQEHYFVDYHKAPGHKDYNTVVERLYYYMDKQVVFSF